MPLSASYRAISRVFLNLGFGEPMFCTLDSRGFRHLCAFRNFCKSSNQPPCLWLSELIFVIFVIPVVLVKSTELQNIGLAKARLNFRNTRVSAPSGPKSQTSRKRVKKRTLPGVAALAVQEVLKESEKSQKQVKKVSC